MRAALNDAALAARRREPVPGKGLAGEKVVIFADPETSIFSLIRLQLPKNAAKYDRDSTQPHHPLEFVERTDSAGLLGILIESRRVDAEDEGDMLLWDDQLLGAAVACI